MAAKNDDETKHIRATVSDTRRLDRDSESDVVVLRRFRFDGDAVRLVLDPEDMSTA